MTSIPSKLNNLKEAINSLDAHKFSHQISVNSISLISENLSRPQKHKNRSAPPDEKIQYKTMKELKESPQKKKHLMSPSSIGLVSKESPSKKDNKQFATNPNSFKEIEEEEPELYVLMTKLYEARCKDMKMEPNPSSFEGFGRTFFSKNRVKKQKALQSLGESNLLTSQFLKQREDEQRQVKKLDLSGMNMMENMLKLVNSLLLNGYEDVDLSRNVIRIHQIINVGKMESLKALRLNNCGMKNEDLSQLFKLLIKTPIKNLSISSPQIKDRNTLTEYDDLNLLITTSQTLESLEMQNIQIQPNYPIFEVAASSKNLIKIDLSKNTNVIGLNKKIQDVNLSWNNIRRCEKFIMPNTNVKRLNLTGNPISPHIFKNFLLTSNFPSLEVLILNRIPIYSEKPAEDQGEIRSDKKKPKKGGKGEKTTVEKVAEKKPHFKEKWLQNFISSTKSLKELQLINCFLCEDYLQNIAFGLGTNHSIQKLDLSLNKFPDQIMEKLAFGIHKSNIKRLWLCGCDVKDHEGVQLFKNMSKNQTLQFLDVSKNSLGTLTSNRICESLKRSCYNILDLRLDQNFIKYDQLKEIDGYIDRNIYLMKIKIKEDHRRLIEGMGNEAEIKRKIAATIGVLQKLEQQTNELEHEYIESSRAARKEELLRMEKQLQLVSEHEKAAVQKVKKIEAQMEEIQNEQQKRKENQNEE